MAEIAQKLTLQVDSEAAKEAMREAIDLAERLKAALERLNGITIDVSVKAENKAEALAGE